MMVSSLKDTFSKYSSCVVSPSGTTEKIKLIFFSILQFHFPKQRAMSKYSEYILKNSLIAVITLPGECLKCKCAHGTFLQVPSFFLIHFLKNLLRNAFFPHLHLRCRSRFIQDFCYLLVSEIVFQCDSTSVKQNLSKRIWLFSGAMWVYGTETC